MLSTAAFAATALAANPIELIAGVGEDLLEDYSRPLIESYGVAMGTGWYHSAHAHRTLGFDFGLRFMGILIPGDAKTFTARVKACSVTTTGEIDTFYVDVEGASTIFGPTGSQPVEVPGQYAAGIPPELPGGLGLGFMPFVLPQLSVGLPLGLEVTARYIPWPFKGRTVTFLGFGLKEELTRWIKKMPVNIAVQGFYQQFTIEDVIGSRTYGANLHVSKSLLLFAPYAGVGFDKTATDIEYTFQARYPSGVGPGGLEYDEVDIPVDASYSLANIRGTLGVALKFGLVLVTADYSRNFSTGYNAVNVGAGIAMR